jgi:hypothetical protein
MDAMLSAAEFLFEDFGNKAEIASFIKDVQHKHENNKLNFTQS